MVDYGTKGITLLTKSTAILSGDDSGVLLSASTPPSPLTLNWFRLATSSTIAPQVVYSCFVTIRPILVSNFPTEQSFPLSPVPSPLNMAFASSPPAACGCDPRMATPVKREGGLGPCPWPSLRGRRTVGWLRLPFLPE